MATDAQYSLAVADWRREVHALYRAVRDEQAPEAAHALWVAGRTELFDRHPASPRMAGQRLRHADYDPSYRFSVPLEPTEADSFQFTTGTDGVVPFERVGRFSLPLAGPQPSTLDVWWLASYGGGLFVPLRDGSAGQRTYGAGRYLLDTVKGADLGWTWEGTTQTFVLDLNFAYNPSCVYDPRWACPLAPAGNRFAAPAPVGELLPEGY